MRGKSVARLDQCRTSSDLSLDQSTDTTKPSVRIQTMTEATSKLQSCHDVASRSNSNMNVGRTMDMNVTGRNMDDRITGRNVDSFAKKASRNHSSGQSERKDSRKMTVVSGKEYEPTNGVSDEISDVNEHVKVLVAMRRKQTGSRFVISSNNRFKLPWTITMILLILYVATIFIYRLAFYHGQIFLDGQKPEPDPLFDFIDFLMGVLFWIDLIVNFFMSFEDETGREVKNLRLIATNYLTSFFLIDALACMPDFLITAIIHGVSEDNGKMTQAVRIVRIQRISRVTKIVAMVKVCIRVARLPLRYRGLLILWFQKQKFLRVLNLAIGLVWVVHILACCNYLVASLHSNPEDTWPYRRQIGSPGNEIGMLDLSHFSQWVQSFYYTLTVFTTVGFGDMSAMTNAEIFYICFTMLVGAMVHSVVVSTVIQVINSNDMVADLIAKNTKLVQAFSQHSQISPDSEHEMKTWASLSSRFWIANQYDKEDMKELILGKTMPPHLLQSLPKEVFHGKLINNKILNPTGGAVVVSPKLPLLLAMHLHMSSFESNDIIYSMGDAVFSVFLVYNGIFSYCSVVQGHVYPYMLICFDSYFGEKEIFFDSGRLANVRCESDGSLLVLPKKDFKDLFSDFPMHKHKWLLASRRKEDRRLDREGQYSIPCFRNLAATMIQRKWIAKARKWRSKKEVLFEAARAHRSTMVFETVEEATVMERTRVTAVDYCSSTSMSAEHSQIRRVEDKIDLMMTAMTQMGKTGSMCPILSQRMTQLSAASGRRNGQEHRRTTYMARADTSNPYGGGGCRRFSDDVDGGGGGRCFSDDVDGGGGGCRFSDDVDRVAHVRSSDVDTTWT